METNNKQQGSNNKVKKNNKIVEWWLGLSKGWKIGLCSGVGALLVTGTTLGIVLPNRGNNVKAETYQTTLSANQYISTAINIKKDVIYKFICNIESSQAVDSFCIMHADKLGQVQFKNAKIEGAAANKWKAINATRIGNERIETGTITITVTAIEDCSSAYGTFECLGA